VIKAIRTTDQGITFRSKLECRWSRFLTSLSIPWEYEPSLIDLGGGLRYLPDFKVSSAYWLEIKGDMGTDENGLTILNKCERLACVSSSPVILAFYDPLAAKCVAFTPQGYMTQAHFGACPTCGGLAVKGESFLLCNHRTVALEERTARRLIFDAMVAARNFDQWSSAPIQ
jgi:hypothetical protein